MVLCIPGLWAATCTGGSDWLAARCMFDVIVSLSGSGFEGLVVAQVFWKGDNKSLVNSLASEGRCRAVMSGLEGGLDLLGVLTIWICKSTMMRKLLCDWRCLCLLLLILDTLVNHCLWINTWSSSANLDGVMLSNGFAERS